MTFASSIETLLAGPSPGIVAVLLVAAISAAAAVFYTLVRLVRDPRARISNDTENPGRLEWDEVHDPAYDDNYARTRGDGTR